VAIEDRWYSPGATYFRVLVDDGDRYLFDMRKRKMSGVSPDIEQGSVSVSGLPVTRSK